MTDADAPITKMARKHGGNRQHNTKSKAKHNAGVFRFGSVEFFSFFDKSWIYEDGPRQLSVRYSKHV
jgi:hypothetical protein